MVSGEEELGELLIMLLESLAHGPASSSDGTKPFFIFSLDLFKLDYEVTLRSRSDALSNNNNNKFYFGT